MEKKIVLEVEQNLVDYIESLDYEINARQELLSFMMKNGMSTDSDSFKKYHDEYKDYFIQFNIAKREIEKEIIKPELESKNINDLSFSWSLDYSTKQLTITIGNDNMEGCKTCSMQK